MEKENIHDLFVEQLKLVQISVTEKQLIQFETYFEQLIQWNNKINLTAITNKDEVFFKHFYDSISLSFYHNMNRKISLIDIGSGAGFPSIPLKIIFPSLQITIVDSLNKRINFLQDLIKKLALEDVLCIHGRAEDLARTSSYREQFDMATARAVAKLNSLNELCIPFLKVGGVFLAMKGSDITDELNKASYSLSELHSKVTNVHELQLPFDLSKRNIIEIHKVTKTSNKYPRKAGIPIKNPLT
jgi:16S rRNA (guanine527-N7)-methyltransferase